MAGATDHPLLFKGSDFAQTEVRAVMSGEGTIGDDCPSDSCQDC